MLRILVLQAFTDGDFGAAVRAISALARVLKDDAVAARTRSGPRGGSDESAAKFLKLLDELADEELGANEEL